MKGFVETVLVFAIAVGATIIVVSSMSSFMEEGKKAQAFIEARNAILKIDSSIQQLMMESVGARRQIDVDVGDSRLIIAGDEERIKIRLEDFKLIAPGTAVQEGNIQVRSGGMVDAFEDDIDNDGNIDLVLKNSEVLFAVRKIGSPNNWSLINTTNIITQINGTVPGRGIRPRSGIYINDRQETSYGTGYTSLTNKGKNIESSSVLVFVNSTSGIRYEALFTLAANTDFIELEVKNVIGA